jgi:hypothetical protein
MALNEWGRLLAQVLLVMALLAYGKAVHAAGHPVGQGLAGMQHSALGSWGVKS